MEQTDTTISTQRFGLLFIGVMFGFLAGLIVGLAVMKVQMG